MFSIGDMFLRSNFSTEHITVNVSLVYVGYPTNAMVGAGPPLPFVCFLRGLAPVSRTFNCLLAMKDFLFGRLFFLFFCIVVTGLFFVTFSSPSNGRALSQELEGQPYPAANWQIEIKPETSPNITSYWNAACVPFDESCPIYNMSAPTGFSAPINVTVCFCSTPSFVRYKVKSLADARVFFFLVVAIWLSTSSGHMGSRIWTIFLRKNENGSDKVAGIAMMFAHGRAFERCLQRRRGRGTQ
jgi:hypothetical protein